MFSREERKGPKGEKKNQATAVQGETGRDKKGGFVVY